MAGIYSELCCGGAGSYSENTVCKVGEINLEMMPVHHRALCTHTLRSRHSFIPKGSLSRANPVFWGSGKKQEDPDEETHMNTARNFRIEPRTIGHPECRYIYVIFLHFSISFLSIFLYYISHQTHSPNMFCCSTETFASALQHQSRSKESLPSALSNHYNTHNALMTS